MHTLTLNIKNSAYDKISYFLTNLSNDIEIVNHNITSDSYDSTSKPLNLRGVFNKYTSADKVEQENSAWKNHILEQYKQDN